MKAYKLAKEGRYVELKTYLEKLTEKDRKDELEWFVEEFNEEQLRTLKWALSDFQDTIDELKEEKGLI